MAPRLPNPLGAPAELIGALKHLPDIAKHTAAMARDTRALAQIARDMSRVAERTEGIQTMDARMANIEAAMPVLVDVQKDLAQVPLIIAKLDDRSRSSRSCWRNWEQRRRPTALDTPLGRMASRLPGGSKPSKHELEAERDPTAVTQAL